MRVTITMMLAFMLVATVESRSSGSGFVPRDIRIQSKMGRAIMKHSRSLNNNNNVDADFVADYSMKFQGCHHVSQWNNDADEEDDVRIKTKRLVRFRLCPTDSCSHTRSAGCTSKYGDYVVDLNTFVAAYMENLPDEMEEICDDAVAECSADCDDDDCMNACYADMDVEFCFQDLDGNNDDFDAADYSECAQFNMRRRQLLSSGEVEEQDHRALGDDVEYYLGPYCADQGGEIHLGLFSDDTCTTFVQNGESTFYSAMGYELPYSDNSMISSRCLGCGVNNGNGYELKDICNNIYQVAGKCETKMSVEYPNESACTYIEGIKIIREDGVIRTSAVKKSKAAAVSIGLFLTIAVLLAGYVYYLRTKLGRAKINLAAASQATIT